MNPFRVERSCANALALTRRPEADSWLRRVHYPGLPLAGDCPGRLGGGWLAIGRPQSNP